MPPKCADGTKDSDALLLELLIRQRAARAPPPAANPSTRPGAWRCYYKECPAAEKGRLNFARNPTCVGCGRVKHKAMSPPQLQRIPPPEPTVSKRQRGRTAQQPDKAKSQAPAPNDKTTTTGNAQGPAGDAPGLMAATFGDHAPAKLPKPLTPSGSTEAERVGAHTLKEVDVEQLFRRPTTTPTPLPTADEVVAKASPLKASAALASQHAEVQATKAALASLESLGRDHHLYLELSKALQQQEAALAKLNKNAPSGKVLVQELLTARAEQTEEVARWEDRIAAGQRKAKGRLDEQFQALDALIAETTQRRAAVAEAHAKSEQAWQLFNQERRAQYTAVINQFDAKIAAAQIEVTRDAAAMQVVAAPLAVAQAPAPPTPTVDALAQVQADGAAAQQALLKAQEEYQRLLAARNAAEALGPPQLQRFECVQEDLPTMLPEPSPEQWQQLYALNSALEALNAHEMFSGLVFPVTFEQLRCGTEVPRLLLGDKLWSQAFQAEAASESSLVTLQVRQLLRHSLQKHQTKLLQDQANHIEATEQAALSVNTAVDEFRDKKRKVEALTADAA